MRSHKALVIYKLQGEVLGTVMLGVTNDISQLYEHWFYCWVMFREYPIQYLNENPVLGSYL